MTLKEAVGVNAFYIDNETGKKVEHRELYSRVIELLGGLDVVKMFIPFSLIQIREALPKDEHLNNLPIDKWDRASGFHCKGSHCTFIGGGITCLYGKAKITTFSNSDGVCILKEAARQWAEREGITDEEEINEPKFVIGATAFFHTTDSKLSDYNGWQVRIKRMLTSDECDVHDVGYMYEVEGYCGVTFQAFEDELS